MYETRIFSKKVSVMDLIEVVEMYRLQDEFICNECRRNPVGKRDGWIHK